MSEPDQNEALAPLPGLEPHPPAVRASPSPEALTASIVEAIEKAKQKPPEFDWFTEECIIVERQPSIAVYQNKRGHVVIRAESPEGEEDDAFITIATAEALQATITALQRELRAMREERR